MWLVERRANPGFKSQTSGVYYAFVSMSTFGFGDLAPTTTLGRLLTIFWTVFSVFSLTAFGGTISSKLTVSQLSVSTIDSLSQVLPSEICIEVRPRGTAARGGCGGKSPHVADASPAPGRATTCS